MRRFKIKRIEDESGVSGTGIVACGVEFDNGQVVMQWQTYESSLGIYPNIKQLIDIHGHGGKTKVVWMDPDPNEGSEEVENDTEK